MCDPHAKTLSGRAGTRVIRRLGIVTLVLAACNGDAMHGLDAADSRASIDAIDTPSMTFDGSFDGRDAGLPDGTCLMVTPPARCGDGVCDPGCEANSPLDCPADCPIPDGGIPCDGGLAKWTCNASRSARLECFHGVVHVDPCGDTGTCQPVAGNYPDQCHVCVPCMGWNTASPAHGQPYVYNCTATNQRQRCVDVRTGGDCIQGASNSADCCVVTDTCLGGACITQAVGVDDRCP
jgi:hypothetical protein